MTTSQYDRYTTAYDISNGYYWLKEDRDDDDPTNDVRQSGEVSLL